jgi:hypothetical protein
MGGSQGGRQEQEHREVYEEEPRSAAEYRVEGKGLARQASRPQMVDLGVEVAPDGYPWHSTTTGCPR